MLNPVPGAGSTDAASSGSAMKARARLNRYPDGGRGLVRLAPQLRQGECPLVHPGGGQDPLGHVRVGAAHPGGDRAQVVLGQGGGAEVAAQIVAGFGGPEAAVFYTLLGDGERERVGPADRGGRVLAALDRGPAEGGPQAAD